MDEIKENENLSADELIFRIIKMFGGTSIRIPSVNELKLYQYLLNKSDYFSKILGQNKSKNPWKAIIDILKREYIDGLQDVDMQQTVIGFVEILTGVDYAAYRKETDGRQILARKVERSNLNKYKEEQAVGFNDDCPDEATEEDNDQ